MLSIYIHSHPINLPLTSNIWFVLRKVANFSTDKKLCTSVLIYAMILRNTPAALVSWTVSGRVVTAVLQRISFWVVGATFRWRKHWVSFHFNFYQFCWKHRFAHLCQ